MYELSPRKFTLPTIISCLASEGKTPRARALNIIVILKPNNKFSFQKSGEKKSLKCYFVVGTSLRSSLWSVPVALGKNEYDRKPRPPAKAHNLRMFEGYTCGNEGGRERRRLPLTSLRRTDRSLPESSKSRHRPTSTNDLHECRENVRGKKTKYAFLLKLWDLDVWADHRSHEEQWRPPAGVTAAMARDHLPRELRTWTTVPLQIGPT